jgi:hypothetical protein
MNLKKLFFPKVNKFENTLRIYAIFSPNISNIRLAPTFRLFDPKKISLLSGGLSARVFKLKNMDWVVKEGRWDLDLNLFGDAKLPMPAQLTEKVLNLFSFTFLPSTKEILRQYKAYLKFVQYFGYFSKEDEYYHPNLDLIFNSQKNTRDSLIFYLDELENFYKIKFNQKLSEILSSDIKYHNFLPKEYLLIGKSISPINKDKNTYFIVQEFIKGTLLHDIDEKTISNNIKRQMVLLSYLILLMNYQTHLVPDTRPRNYFNPSSSWLTKTDNIIVSENSVKFIDTRWLWDYKSNPIKRGLIIPDMILNNTKSYLLNILKNVE